MTRDNLKRDIEESTHSILKIARDVCWNSISDNCLYIISKIDNSFEGNIFRERRNRKIRNEKKTPKSIDTVTEELKLIYEDLYDVNFYIYKSLTNKTIIEIQYYSKSDLSNDFYTKVKNNPPMVHCKITYPFYHNGKNKFDINWELGGLNYQLNSFIWKLKNKITR